MTDTAATARTPYAAAIYLAFIQFLFVTCWTLYVIYLPALLETAGLPRRYAPWILILDQITFMVMDVVMGIAADRAARTLGRVGPLIMALTAVSCIAFLLIPHLGGASSAVLLALILAWTITSSALRAPPWVLLDRYAATPSVPWLSALMLTGLAVGGAVAPYLGITMKNVDPRLPFAVSSLVLLAATAGLIWVERDLARRGMKPAPATAPRAGLNPGSWLFVAGCLLLALGFQVHFSLNSARQYLQFFRPDALQYLMPVFWIGFNVAMFPGAALAKRYGTLPVVAGAALAGAGGTIASVHAGSLDALIAAQLIAGGAWGCVMMASFSAALEFGRAGREGLVLGLLFAALAGATLARIGAVIAELGRSPAVTPALDWTPFVLWLAAGLLFAALSPGAARGRASP
jgi:MFS family permease